MASDDWLDTSPAPVASSDKGAGLLAPVVLPEDYKARAALLDQCWQQLTPPQKTFLQAWRDCRFNARAANRQVHGRDHTNTSHTLWCRNDPNYAMVMRIWRANAGLEALDRDRLLARQDDIVETALTPKPVLWQGVAVRDPRDPTGTAVLEEVEVSAASRANEVLMKAAGLFPREGAEINVGVTTFTPVTVEVAEAPNATLDAEEVVEVNPVVPE